MAVTETLEIKVETKWLYVEQELLEALSNGSICGTSDDDRLRLVGTETLPTVMTRHEFHCLAPMAAQKFRDYQFEVVESDVGNEPSAYVMMAFKYE